MCIWTAVTLDHYGKGKEEFQVLLDTGIVEGTVILISTVWSTSPNRIMSRVEKVKNESWEVQFNKEGTNGGLANIGCF